jgi:molybdate transport system permease protein
MPGRDDWDAVLLTLRLAGLTTALLLLLGTPLAWWLARTRSRLKSAIAAVVALPLVLPPTVLGFYLLVALGPHGAVGRLTVARPRPAAVHVRRTGDRLGAVFAAVRGAADAERVRGDRRAAAGSRRHAARTAARPLRLGGLAAGAPGLLTAAVLGFAHTVGEFGVVLMIGGNIPGRTRVASVQIYDHVEALEYTQAHWLSAGMLAFSFAVLLALYAFNAKRAAP